MVGCGAGSYHLPETPMSPTAQAQMRSMQIDGAEGAPSMPSAQSRPSMPSPIPPPGAAAAKAPPPTTSTHARAASTSATSSKPTVSNLYIIYAGVMDLTVAPKAEANTLEKAIGVASGLGGHLVRLERGRVVLKVPSTSFRDAMHAISEFGEVTNQEVHAEDVTDEFRDLEVRLQNLRATRSRIEEFLKRAQQLADTLTLEKELERVAMEIDRIEGRLHLLRERSAMSEITLAVSAPAERAAPAVVVKERHGLTPLMIPVEWLQSIGLSSLLNVQGS